MSSDLPAVPNMTPFSTPDPARRDPPFRLPALLLVVLVAWGCVAGSDPPAREAADAASPVTVPDDDSRAPRLAVLVVVDQLGPELLSRYDDLWTGGLRRLRDEGFSFGAASHAHAVTETAAGHATLATGVPPERHGIVANGWSEPSGDGGWRYVYAVSDPEAPILGRPDAAGRSPANLRRDGLADWLSAAGRDARVVSVSSKDRSAVTLAGRVRDAHVYWIDQAAGRFVTSTWYRDRYPDWVEAVNRDVVAGIFADTVWESSVPPSERWRTRPDTAPMEGVGGGHSTFPHRAMEELPDDVHEWVMHTPRPDSAVLELAVEAIHALELGRRESPDLLAVSFSQSDYVGHWYGPMSREQLDNLLHLDRMLGRLIDALDRDVGEGRWVLALSSDHGVLPFPEWLQETESWGMRLSRRDQRALSERLRGLAREGSDVSEADLARAAEEVGLVARAYTHADLRSGEYVDSFAPLYLNSLVEGRAAGRLSRFGVELRFEPGVLQNHAAGGTGHGSPYWYDRHVPLVFLGAAVTGGGSEEAVFTWDVAPTLADLLGIPERPDLRGRSLRRSWEGR